uniref:Uncharacterized protein n=1 Tax=Tanacetum cinerariifolium TaxID=118510 RepID=A0A699HQ34_TANCI|nr:hypothetical protein [Tanacetum cinerariifolium]
MSSESDKLNLREGTAENQGVGASGASCDGSSKVSNYSPLVSPTITINMPRGLYNINVAATFGVLLTTISDLYMLTKDIEAGKHDELLSGMINDKRMAVMDALGAICDSVQAENNNTNVIPCKVSHVDDLTIVDTLVAKNLNRKGHDQNQVQQEGQNWIKVYQRQTFVSIPIIVITPNVPTPTVAMTNDGFQTMGKKKKKGTSKSTNSGQTGGHSVKQNLRKDIRELLGNGAGKGTPWYKGGVNLMVTGIPGQEDALGNAAKGRK